ncbi:MAG: hypothetical protein M3Y59_09105 [Myxococcota bacterium]|nr:hypothetical protein [Myxococcota bacterium]
MQEITKRFPPEQISGDDCIRQAVLAGDGAAFEAPRCNRVVDAVMDRVFRFP